MYGRKQLCANLRCYPSISLEGLRKTLARIDGFVPFDPRSYLMQNRNANHSTVTFSIKLNYASYSISYRKS